MSTTQATSQPVRIAGLAANDYGRSDGRPPLILLHGMPFDRTTWRDIIPELQHIDPGRRVIAIDLPGHGHSPDQPAYELDTIVEQIHRVAEEAGITAPVVVGHSAWRLRDGLRGALPDPRGREHRPPAGDRTIHYVPESFADRLRGPEFPVVWQMFYDGFHVELLPPPAQDLVRATCRPRQQVVLGYWRQLIEQPIAEVTAMVEQATAAARLGRALPPRRR